MQKNFFCGFEPIKMHCEFTYTTNAFLDESWDLSNFICYEGSRTKILVIQTLGRFNVPNWKFLKPRFCEEITKSITVDRY